MESSLEAVRVFSLDGEHDVTQLLGVVREKGEAADELFPLVYHELRNIADRFLAGERSDHTLQATALVHEAYVHLIGDLNQPRWRNRGHFFAIASQAMRRILVDHARKVRSQKRGGDRARVEFTELFPDANVPNDDVLALDEALSRLAETEPLDSRIVEMRFFAGLSLDEIAEILEVNERTIRRHWNYAKAWLYRELTKDDTRFDPCNPDEP